VEAKLSWESGDKVYMQNFVEQLLKENHKTKIEALYEAET
jgi:hypothetical protein